MLDNFQDISTVFIRYTLWTGFRECGVLKGKLLSCSYMLLI